MGLYPITYTLFLHEIVKKILSDLANLQIFLKLKPQYFCRLTITAKYFFTKFTFPISK